MAVGDDQRYRALKVSVPMTRASSEAISGLVTEGNIDLAHRPIVKNADGTISTVRSESFGIDGKEVLLPTVSDDGRILTTDQAVKQYRDTGKHLGVFNSPETATAYAQELHRQQEKMYASPADVRLQQGSGMATDDKNRYPKFVDWGFDLNRTPGQAVMDTRNKVGDGALGAGAVTREMLRQGFVRPTQNVINSVAGGVANAVQPTQDFYQGLVYGGPAPLPAADRSATPGATGSWGVSSNFPTLRSVVSPEQTAPAPALTRTPSRGQPAPAVPAPSADTQRQAAPVYSMDRVPEGGGYMEWGDRGARGGAGSLSITPQRARELSGQSSIVPAGTIPQLGLGSQPAYGAAQGLGRPDAPRRSRLIGDRSQDFDSVLKNLVAQATREPDSYGELFRRKGVLNALNDIAGVATSAGTNAAQDIANVRNAVEQRLDTELTDQSREADRGVTTHGQDRLYESNRLRNQVVERNAKLQATTQQKIAAARDATLTAGQKSRSADTAAQIASQEKLAELAPVYRLQSEPVDLLGLEIAKRRGEPDSPALREWLANALPLYDRLKGQQNVYDLLRPQAQ